MKSKKLTLILAIFFVIVVITTLFSTMFMLASIKVNFLNDANVLFGTETRIIESGEFEFGQNILFLSKKKYISNLETKNPYLQVVNIESIFPNKIVINCLERKELFYFQLDTNNIVVLDKFYKVLKTVNNTEVDQFVNGNILISGFEFEDVSVGKIIKVDLQENQKLNCIYKGLFMWNESEDFLKSKLLKIEIFNGNVNLTTTDNKKIFIENFTLLSEDKFNVAFSTYVSGVMIDNNYIKIYEDSSGKIVSVVGK